MTANSMINSGDTFKYQTNAMMLALVSVFSLFAMTTAIDGSIYIPYNCETVDIVFVVDGSGSVGVENFTKMKTWILGTSLEILQTMSQKVQLGCLVYSNKENKQTPFRLGDECSNRRCLEKRLKATEFSGGSTYTESALRFTLDVLFPESPRANNSNKFIILITDGDATDSNLLPDWYRDSVFQNITTFAVGVGSNYDKEQLQIIANGNSSSERVFFVDNFNALPEIRQAVRIISCEVPMNATCNDTIARCSCLPGYTAKGEECVDLDECVSQSHACTSDKICQNTHGSYNCQCSPGFLPHGSSCEECPCISKAIFGHTDAHCPGVDELACKMGKLKSCRVAGRDAFGPVFRTIDQWRTKSHFIESSEAVVEQVTKIDNAIKCAAIATSKYEYAKRNGPDIEAISMSGTLSSIKQIVKMSNFSNSRIMTLSIPEQQLSSHKIVVAVQFQAPQSNMELLNEAWLHEEPNPNIRKTTFTFTGSNPIISISAFDVENFTTYENVQTLFEIGVSEDFSNTTHWSRKVEEGYGRSFVRNVTYQCVSINTSSAQMTDLGCRTKYNIGSSVSCECNHTTMFAVLLKVQQLSVPHGVRIVSYVTEILSILCLVLTTVILLSVRSKVRGDRIGVQICLSATLLLFHICNIVAEAARENEITCGIITALIHYLLLASAMWMLMEGVTLVAKTNDHVLQYLSGGNIRKLTIARHVLSWGIPLMLVVPPATVGLLNGTYIDTNPMYLERIVRDNPIAIKQESKYNYCWLSQEMRVWFVVVPMGIILLANTIIMFRMAHVVYMMSSKEDQLKPSTNDGRIKLELNHAKAAFKATLLLMPVCGIPWTLGFLTSIDNRHSTIFFMYLNVLLNGLQGVFLFIVYCIIGMEVRKALRNKFKRMEYTRNSLNDSKKPSKSIHSAHIKSNHINTNDQVLSGENTPVITAKVNDLQVPSTNGAHTSTKL